MVTEKAALSVAKKVTCPGNARKEDPVEAGHVSSAIRKATCREIVQMPEVCVSFCSVIYARCHAAFWCLLLNS